MGYAKSQREERYIERRMRHASCGAGATTRELETLREKCFPTVRSRSYGCKIWATWLNKLSNLAQLQGQDSSFKDLVLSASQICCRLRLILEGYSVCTNITRKRANSAGGRICGERRAASASFLLNEQRQMHGRGSSLLQVDDMGNDQGSKCFSFCQ